MSPNAVIGPLKQVIKATDTEDSYRLAADQGNAGAQYDLAVAYSFGEGVKQDTATADDWYRKAAKDLRWISKRMGIDLDDLGAAHEGVVRFSTEADITMIYRGGLDGGGGYPEIRMFPTDGRKHDPHTASSSAAVPHKTSR